MTKVIPITTIKIPEIRHGKATRVAQDYPVYLANPEAKGYRLSAAVLQVEETPLSMVCQDRNMANIEHAQKLVKALKYFCTSRGLPLNLAYLSELSSVGN
ncbi:hypothetical protein A2291_04005 [candidate division WOR-1 bacterium RIFOXYB2_FULL_42_35]|uniref:Uncharacterized protein n=1 Tax=candidate division WOR-1 bacterium RIFOXYC2_FULL_41_25 TaxID=1802586 RepID=A0A1F4TMR0_UNCSA|nr:MAG: hypothetical protein A2247_00845 [candidate division WOR-1 bacterium RIFOXYA2_FULL_41_14]OGC24296.1 MAG: hypothetical protein A2291_04005 [candidate division WOR-1 bacterium RIFOXYB2_FULL_42_35]OGC33998.1 MAG: hypothetical protein A2462_01410 [candidate division WOR-1 bacterium RIFOXYC2_FULL_41_25]OGC43150.1 MAG: hypothetical protein A2548_01785 [candidate division WOR-1 bacterium RIFOXYD2_FULL_41_8]